MLRVNLKEFNDRKFPVDFTKITLWPWRRCKVRILIVADGGIDFGSSAFGLQELITQALNTSSRPFVDFVITTAHRGNAPADLLRFRFDNSQSPAPATNKAFSIKNYDQVWLFGVERNATMPASELLAITNFMDDGGGVFATGDHENLGQNMCAEIPRVRSMRKWYWPTAPAGRLVAPNGSGTNRLDTTVVGDTPNFQFADQSDETPQNIIPQLFTVGTTAQPHPLLSKSGGIIRNLPDHAHEGECVVPTNLTEKVLATDARDEYPFISGGSTRVVPQLVAISYSGAGTLTDIGGKPAVNARCFGAIAAYDGHLAKKGRVSVDSTWHHFLNINLKGTGSTRPGDNGLYVGGVPTAEYEDIKQYFRNIALWLSPKKLQLCFRFRYIYFIRYTFPLIWEVRPILKPTWKDLAKVGQQTRQMIAQSFSQSEVLEAATTLLDAIDVKGKNVLANLINPSIPEDENLRPALLGDDLIIDLILGGVMQNIVNELPEFPNEVNDIFSEKSDDKKLESIITAGAKLGIENLHDVLKEQAGQSKKLVKSLRDCY